MSGLGESGRRLLPFSAAQTSVWEYGLCSPALVRPPMRNVAIAAVLLVAFVVALLVIRPSKEDSGFGTPPPLAAGKAPPLPRAGTLAFPRSLEQVGLPRALTASKIPAGSSTPATIALGEKLFFESRLSCDQTVSCASCHNPVRA